MPELEGGIVGRDASALVGFYEDVMGFTEHQRLEFDDFGTVVKLRRGDARVKLFFPQAPLDPPRRDDPWFRGGGWRYAALYLDAPAAVDDLATAVVAAGGASLLAPYEHRPGARMALVTDPEGNPWELLCERGTPDG